jgi:phage tail-like protein
VSSLAQPDERGFERYLPAFYRADPFWARLLKPFEKVLSGVGDGVTIDGAAVPGLEEVVDGIHRYFDPDETPRDFLKWLAAWLALSLREDWDEPTQRSLIRSIASLYPIRGTRRGLEAMLDLYLRASDPPPPGLPPEVAVSIVEPVALQIGTHSTVGVDTWVGGGAPHLFTVRVDFDRIGPRSLDLRPRAVVDIVDREKPAHTYYELELLIPTLQVGVRSRVGVDTVLGNKLV